MSNDTILSVQNLVTSFQTESGKLNAVEGVSFDLLRGSTLGIVGESGCGKSVTSLSVMRLLPKPSGNIDQGKILFEGKNLLDIPIEEMRTIRGNRISMIFQEPMTALNPVHTIGKQLSEVFNLHFPKMSDKEIRQSAIHLLDNVGIPSPDLRLNDHPHQLSGGMRQRIMIAMALACKPDILIADEPTTALDVTIQAQILDLIKVLQKESGMSVIFITHDLGVIAEVCDQVVVMYAGKVVESAPVEAIFDQAKHPYTSGLIRSIPRLTDTPKTKLVTIEGSVPDLMSLPKGCRFINRCAFADEKCHQPPECDRVNVSHRVYCHHWKTTQQPIEST